MRQWKKINRRKANRGKGSWGGRSGGKVGIEMEQIMLYALMSMSEWTPQLECTNKK